MREINVQQTRLRVFSTHAGRLCPESPPQARVPTTRSTPCNKPASNPKTSHVDTADGAKASRPKLDLLKLVRSGDTVVVTRLNRLGRSMLHLVNLGADLRDRGVDLRVVEQGIDTRPRSTVPQ